MNDLNELLAKHEWIVAQFYIRNKRYLGALWRLEYIRENFPNYSQIDSVNEKIPEMKTVLEERESAWKKQLEELKKESED